MAEQTSDYEAFQTKIKNCTTCITELTRNFRIQFALSFDTKKPYRAHTKYFEDPISITDANAPTLIVYEDAEPNGIIGYRRLNGDQKLFYRSYELDECKDIPESQLINELKAVQLTKQDIIDYIELKNRYPGLFYSAILNDTQLQNTPDTQPLLTITPLKSLAMPLDTYFQRTNYRLFKNVYAIYNCKLPNVNRCSTYHV